MSVDFQVVFPSETIRLSRVALVPGSSPPVLDITGEDFRSVDEVIINDVASEEVVILSETRMLATVPATFNTTVSLDSIVVVSRNLTITPKSLIRFQVGRQPSKVSGILRLVQLFLKLLFTTPGTDAFTPTLGGAGLSGLGKNFSNQATNGAVSNFIISVDRTSKQIVGIQSRDPAIPRQERLLSAKVVSAKFSANETALVVSVELTSQAGQAAVANVVL